MRKIGRIIWNNINTGLMESTRKEDQVSLTAFFALIDPLQVLYAFSC